MNFENIVTRYIDKLMKGDRAGCRQVLGEALQTGTPARGVYTELFWPVMCEVERLYRNHRINIITEHMATRINRTLVDQLQAKLPRQESNGKNIVITCSADEPEELGAQMCADLFESDGWTVKFLGGGVPVDETISLVGTLQPDILFIYGTKPSSAPDVRRMIDELRNINACPNLRVMVSGGIFNRAEGLWEEIGADMFAPTAKEALQIALTNQRSETSRKRRTRIPSLELEESSAQI